MKGAKALIICSSFAPVNSSSVHRTSALCRELFQANWKLYVLTMPATSQTSSDPDLLEKIPSTVEVFHMAPWSIRKYRQPTPLHRNITFNVNREKPTKATRIINHLREWISWWLQIPDKNSGWCVPAVIESLKIIRRHSPDIIYSTAPAWTCHLSAAIAAILSHKPLILDFRDPWVANPFRKFVYKAHKTTDRILENAVLKTARAVICNTDEMRGDFVKRYPLLSRKFITINNGYDAELIQKVSQNPVEAKNEKCIFIHAGNFYGPRSPIPLLRAIKQAAKSRLTLNSMHWYHAGPMDYDGVPLEQIIRTEGVEDCVTLLGKLSHFEVLTEICKADVAVAVGINGPGGELQVPRKLFEYIALNKPVLMTGRSCSAVRTLISEKDAKDYKGLFLCDGLLDETIKKIRKIVKLWKADKLKVKIPDIERFSDKHMSRRILSIFEETIAAKRQKNKCLTCVPSR